MTSHGKVGHVAVRIGSLPDEFIMVLAYLVMCPRYGMLFKLKRV